MNTDNFEKAVALRHELHAHPELSEHEEWTRARLMDFLRENTSLKITDKGQWFYASYISGNDKPGIGFRADIDALPMNDEIDAEYKSSIPGVGHKCGHDGHAATLCGLALELERVKPDRDVHLIFQHAEENGAGAKECGDFVKETGISEIYAYHNTSGLPANTVKLFRTFYACASVGMNIEMTGVVTHASSPEKGKNPALALSRLALKTAEIADQSRFETLVMATIVELNVGEHAFGVSAHRGNLAVTLRAVQDKDMYQIRDEIKAEAEKLAEEGGFGLEITYEDFFPDTTCTEAESEKIVKAAGILGFPVWESPAPNRGSEDFGWFLKQVKGSMFDFSSGEKAPSLHSKEFDFDDKLISGAVDMFMTLITL